MNAATRPTSPTDGPVRQLSADATLTRDRTQETAQRLSLLAMRNWEKALTGAVAVPAAAALTTGAAMLFAISIVERTFEMFDASLGDVGRRVGEGFDAQGELSSSDAASSANVGPAASMAPATTFSVARSERTVARSERTLARSERTLARSERGVTRPERGVARSERAVSTSATSASAPARESKQARTKTEDTWDVVLVDAGANPIALVRELRGLTGRELRDLEMLVGGVPEPVTRAVPLAEAESLRDRIEAAGGRVEVRRGSAQASNP